MMAYKRLTRDFFVRPTLIVSKELLGKYLVHEYKGQILSGMIVEAEAYIGPQDRASHAYGGKRTKRNLAEYMVGGHIYIYLVYGMYWQLNISTSFHDVPECVLIRALQPADGIPLMKKFRRTDKESNLADGPGKLCQALKLDKSFYGYDICQKNARIYVEDRGINIPLKQIKKGPRIGIDYAGPKWSKVPWRFYVS